MFYLWQAVHFTSFFFFTNNIERPPLIGTNCGRRNIVQINEKSELKKLLLKIRSCNFPKWTRHKIKSSYAKTLIHTVDVNSGSSAHALSRGRCPRSRMF
jgi:hypothetical protein